MIDLRTATSDALEVLKRAGLKILAALKRLPLPGRTRAASEEAPRPEGGSGGAVGKKSRSPRIDFPAIARSRPFIVGAGVLAGAILIIVAVSAIISRPLPAGRDRLTPLPGLASLDDFRLPDSPKRYETVLYSRDPEARADPAELSAYLYLPGPEIKAEATRLEREAVEEFYEGIE